MNHDDLTNVVTPALPVGLPVFFDITEKLRIAANSDGGAHPIGFHRVAHEFPGCPKSRSFAASFSHSVKLAHSGSAAVHDGRFGHTAANGVLGHGSVGEVDHILLSDWLNGFLTVFDDTQCSDRLEFASNVKIHVI